MENNQRTIVVTGGAGYVGEILCAEFVKRDDVRRVIAIDKDPETDFLRQLPKLTYIQCNLADPLWQAEVATYEPDTIVHTAWQIRALYGEGEAQWRLNVDGSEAVFRFAFSYPSVKKLVHFSTAASYSARRDNTLTHYFTEAEGLRDDEYIYAKEKKAAEELLEHLYAETLKEDRSAPQVTILRPVAITGPRGRFLRSRFGLQSALRGDLEDTFFDRTVSLLTSFFPATKLWVRQFIHEDDVADIITHFVFANTSWAYEVFNGTPTGKPVSPQDMAAAVGKRVLPLWPIFVRLAFFGFWHLSRGKVPTCPHSWRFYAYPILLSGEKLAALYRCRYDSLSAITYSNGRYESEVPIARRHSRETLQHENN